MTELQLKTKIGFLLITVNIIVISLTIVFYLIDGFLFDEMTTIIALIVPMFSVYTTAIIKGIVEQKEIIEDKTSKVNMQFIAISWLFPSLFSVYLIIIVTLKAFNVGFSSFEEFKTMLVASESVFGGYAGLILSSLFNVKRNTDGGNSGNK